MLSKVLIGGAEMNKLTHMIGAATRLATQNPAAEDVLDWSSRALQRSIADWYGAQTAQGAELLLINVAARYFPLWQSAAVTAVTAEPVPHGWRSSHRHPGDLALDEAAVLSSVRKAVSLQELRAALNASGSQPWCADATVDRVVAPFLMNVYSAADLPVILGQLARVLRQGGRIDLLALAADEPLDSRVLQVAGQELQHFPVEAALAAALANAGFHGVQLEPLLEGPVLTVAGVELRAFALVAHTGTRGVCLDQGDAAIYLGPWSSVTDDDGHSYPRGQRIAVCAKTAAVLRRAPYAGSFLILAASNPPPLDAAPPFDCSRDVIRDPAETKGRVSTSTACCDSGCGC
jgi:hypothetical protein